MGDVWGEGFACRDYLRGIGPDRGNKGSAVDHHK